MIIFNNATMLNLPCPLGSLFFQSTWDYEIHLHKKMSCRVFIHLTVFMFPLLVVPSTFNRQNIIFDVLFPSTVIFMLLTTMMMMLLKFTYNSLHFNVKRDIVDISCVLLDSVIIFWRYQVGLLELWAMQLIRYEIED